MVDLEVSEFVIPPDGKYIWEWYSAIDRCINRIHDNICFPIPLIDYKLWAELTGNIVYPWEYDILMGMDEVFCDEMTKELQAREEKRLEQESRKR